MESARYLQKAARGEKQLSVAGKYAHNRLRIPLGFIGAQSMVPDVKTHLSATEESVRAKLTYQAWDRGLLSACGLAVRLSGEAV